MAILTEGAHFGDAILSEANGNRSREVVNVKASTTITPGQVVALTVAAGVTSAVVLSPSGSDGSETASGVAIGGAKTTAGQSAKVLVLARDAEVKVDELVWPSGITQPQKAAAIADLASAGIIVR